MKNGPRPAPHPGQRRPHDLGGRDAVNGRSRRRSPGHSRDGAHDVVGHERRRRVTRGMQGLGQRGHRGHDGVADPKDAVGVHAEAGEERGHRGPRPRRLRGRVLEQPARRAAKASKRGDVGHGLPVGGEEVGPDRIGHEEHEVRPRRDGRSRGETRPGRRRAGTRRWRARIHAAPRLDRTSRAPGRRGSGRRAAWPRRQRAR